MSPAAKELAAKRAAEVEAKRKVATFILAAFFHAADRCNPAGAEAPAKSFDAAEAFMAEASRRGIPVEELLGE